MKRVVKFLYQLVPFKKLIFLGLKKIATPTERVYRHLYFKDVFTVNVNEHARFDIRHYGYQIENELFWRGLTGGWEKTSMDIWMKLCKTADVIVDIGANTGVYSLVAKAIRPTADVFAFEPVKRVYSKLAENNRLNGFDIRCYEMAASDKDGQAVIYDTGEEHILSVTLNKNMHAPGITALPVTVNTTRLSSFIEQQKILKIDLIKVDVETHEPEVMEGLGPYLDRDLPALLIEVLDDAIGTQIERIVYGKNYLYFNIDEENGIRKTASILKSDHYNYLLCQPATAVALGLVSQA
jgi:FkbM family methyltransferase